MPKVPLAPAQRVAAAQSLLELSKAQAEALVDRLAAFDEELFSISVETAGETLQRLKALAARKNLTTAGAGKKGKGDTLAKAVASYVSSFLGLGDK